MIFVNFKTYKESTGENAVKLAIICEMVSEQTNVHIIPVVQAVDLWHVKQHVSIPVWAQHIDHYEAGAHTGFTTIESILQADAAGTILNHSEHPVPFEQLSKTVNKIKLIDPSFGVLICAPDLGVLTHTLALSPNYISYEPPDLIGSKTDSVVSKKAGVVSEGVKMSKDVPLIVGAGIKSKDDVVTSLRCNAKGVLVSSSVVLSDKPEGKLHELATAFMSD